MLGIELTESQYCKLLRMAKKIPNWNALPEKERKLFIEQCMKLEDPCGNQLIFEELHHPQYGESKKLLADFERTIGLAELRALSTYSLEHPLSNQQYERMMELGKKWLNSDTSG